MNDQRQYRIANPERQAAPRCALPDNAVEQLRGYRVALQVRLILLERRDAQFEQLKQVLAEIGPVDRSLYQHVQN